MNCAGERGYSLVEVMISGALVAIAVMGLGLLQSSQFRSLSGLSQRMTAKTLDYQILQGIAQQPGDFLYFESSAGVPVVYVGCFDRTGAPVATAATSPVATTGFVGVFTIDQATAAFKQPITSPAICDQNPDGLEAHVATDRNGTRATVVLLQIGQGIIPKSEAAIVSRISFGLQTTPPGALGGTHWGKWCAPPGPCPATTVCTSQTSGGNPSPGYVFCY